MPLPGRRNNGGAMMIDLASMTPRPSSQSFPLRAVWSQGRIGSDLSQIFSKKGFLRRRFPPSLRSSRGNVGTWATYCSRVLVGSIPFGRNGTIYSGEEIPKACNRSGSTIMPPGQQAVAVSLLPTLFVRLFDHLGRLDPAVNQTRSLKQHQSI